VQLTRIWLALVGLVLAAVLAVALVVPRAALRELEKEEVARLTQLQTSAQLLLKLDARNLIDLTAHLAADAVLGGALEETARGANDKALSATMSERLRSFHAQVGLSFMVAVDGRGRVLARVRDSAEAEAMIGDSLAGFPVVADAVRGYRGEDLLAISGRLYHLAASPVFSRSRERYVGALVVGSPISDELAGRLRERLGTDVTFFLRGKPVATSTRAGALGRVPDLLARLREDPARPATVGLEAGPDRFWMAAAALPGEAGQQDAFLVLLLPRGQGTGLGGFLRAAHGDDLKGPGVPWLLVVIALLATVVVGLAILWWEGGAPLARLSDEVGRLAAGELPRIDERSYRARFGAIVRSINATLDRLVRSGAGAAVSTIPAAPARREAEQPLPESYQPLMEAGAAAPVAAKEPQQDQPGPPLLDEVGREPGTGPADRRGQEAKVAAPPLPRLPGQENALPAFPVGHLLEEDAMTSPQTPAVTASARSARGGRRDAPELPELPQFEAIPLDGTPSRATPAARPAASSLPPPARASVGAGAPGLRPERSVSAPLPARAPAAAAAASLPPRTVAPRSALGPPPASSRPTLGPSRRPTPFGMPIEEDLLGLMATTAAPTPGGSGEVSLPAMTAGSDPDFNDSTLVSQPSRDLLEQAQREKPGRADDLDEYFRKVYQDFLDLKRRCGEPTENVTFEKFVAKLRDNRDQLIRKLGCKSVRFQVYIKDGKAALKASPVRE
jgi:hypothetical protein